MMGSSVPDTGAEALLYKLLTATISEESARKTLAEIVGQVRSSEKSLEESRKATADLETVKKNIENMQSALAAKAAEHAKIVSEQTNALKIRADALAAQSKELAIQEADLKAKHDRLDAEEAAMKEATKKHLADMNNTKLQAAADLAKSHDLLEREHASKMVEVEKYAATLVAKEARLEEELKAAEVNKAYWTEKAGALKAIIG